MVPGKLFLMDGFQEGDPCLGQSKENRQMANKLPDPISFKIDNYLSDIVKGRHGDMPLLSVVAPGLAIIRIAVDFLILFNR
jgi:hypothetical protein